MFALVSITPAAWVLVVDIGYKSRHLFLHLSLKLVVGVVCCNRLWCCDMSISMWLLAETGEMSICGVGNFVVVGVCCVLCYVFLYFGNSKFLHVPIGI